MKKAAGTHLCTLLFFLLATSLSAFTATSTTITTFRDNMNVNNPVTSSSSAHYHHHHRDGTTLWRLSQSTSPKEESSSSRKGWKGAILRVLPGRRRSKNSQTFMVATTATADSSSHSFAATHTTIDRNATKVRSHWMSAFKHSIVQQNTPAVAVTPTTAASAISKTTPTTRSSSRSFEGGSVTTRMTRSYLEHVLMSILERHSTQPLQNVTIQVAPKLQGGRAKATILLSSGKMVFPRFQLSSGQVEAKKVTLNLWSLVHPAGHRRYLSHFDLLFRNVTFTDTDLLESCAIRHGLEQLLLRVMSQKGIRPNEFTISSISILECGKVLVSGQVTSLVGKVPFEVGSYLSTTSRGHVITFHGLGVTVAGVTLPVVHRTMDVDLGHNAQIEILDLTHQGQVKVSAKVTITPTKKLAHYRQARDSYFAQHMMDVGRWFTNIGNFTA